MGTPGFETVHNLIVQGRFRYALDVLQDELRHLRSQDQDLYETYRAELLYETGFESLAVDIATSYISRRIPAGIAARLHYVLSLASFNESDLTSARYHLRLARSLCDGTDRTSATFVLTLFGLALSFVPV